MGRSPRARARTAALLAAVLVALPAGGAAPVGAAGPVYENNIPIQVPTGNKISGRLTNANDNPIPNFSLSACTTSAAQECRSEATSNALGEFTIQGLIPDTYVLSFAPTGASDYLRGWWSDSGAVPTSDLATPVDVTDGDECCLDVLADRGQSISGKVTGAGGAGALAGVQVEALGSFSPATVTDASGNYKVRGLEGGDYQLAIRVPSTLNFRGGGVHAGGVVQDEFTGDVLHLSGANVTGKNVVAPAGLRISGTLSGPGAAGAEVTASGGSSGTAIAAANGQWSISGLWPGTYQLIFQPPNTHDFHSLFPYGYWSGGPTLTADGEQAANIVLTSANVTGRNASIPNGLSLSGTVTGDEGSPLELAYVSMCGDLGACVSTVTSAAGTWSLDHVLPDKYLIQVSHAQHVGGYFGSGAYAIDAAHARKVSVTNADVAGVDVVLPSGATFTGYVIGPEFEVVPGAHVSAIGSGGIGVASGGNGDTDADGLFTLRGLDDGDYIIRVDFEPDRGYVGGYFDVLSDTFYTDDVDLASPYGLVAAIGSSYIPINPKRVVDSRSGLGVTSVFTANFPRTFKVAGVSPIPANAIAVTGNVTVVGQTAAGYVSLSPTATATPKSSTLNFPLGDVRANNFTLPLSAAGRMSAVYKAATGKTAHLLIDITGYFVEGDSKATFKSVSPVRVLDSRSGLGLHGPFVASVPQTLSIAGSLGIPADAKAITANVTVVGQTKAGFVAVTTNRTVNPTTSTMNFPVGDTRANGLTAQLDVNGDLSIVYKAPAGSTAQFLLDVTGYYRNTPTGALFYALPPARIVDTRPGILASEVAGSLVASSAKPFGVTGHGGVPLGAIAMTGNLTIVNQTAGGYASITSTPTATPSVSTINFPLGDTRANGLTAQLTATGSAAIVYKAPSGQKTNAILDVTGYFR